MKLKRGNRRVRVRSAQKSACVLYDTGGQSFVKKQNRSQFERQKEGKEVGKSQIKKIEGVPILRGTGGEPSAKWGGKENALIFSRKRRNMGRNVWGLQKRNQKKGDNTDRYARRG